jgi:hypothetical protein
MKTHETTDQRNNETTDPRTNETTKPRNNNRGSMTIDFPENIYQGIHQKAGRLHKSKKEVLIDGLKASAREERDLRIILEELIMPLEDFRMKCRHEQADKILGEVNG